VFLDHLLEVDCFWPRPRDQEVHGWVDLADARDCGDEEVGALVVEETGDDNDRDVVF